MSIPFTNAEIQLWITNPQKNPRNGKKLNTNARNGIYAKLKKEAISRGLLPTSVPVPVPGPGPVPGPVSVPVPVPVPSLKALPRVIPRLPATVPKKLQVPPPVPVPSAPAPVPLQVPVPSPAVSVKVPVPVQVPVPPPAPAPAPAPVPPTPATAPTPVPATAPVLVPPVPVLPKVPAATSLVIPEHTFSNPFSCNRAKYYLYCGLDENEEEPGLVLIVNSNWSGLIDELWQQAHLLDSLVEHGIAVIEVPIDMTDFRDFIPFQDLEGNEAPDHPLHYLDPQYQIPSISQYLNKDYDLQEARMTIEYISGLEEHFPDLGSLGSDPHRELIQKIDAELAPVMHKRKLWEEKYLEYYTDEDWFYIDFLKIVQDLSVDEFVDLCHKAFKKRVPETWLAERYRDTEEIEEFLAHFECTIDELYGSEINREGSDEYEERLNTIITEFHRIKQGSEQT